MLIKSAFTKRREKNYKIMSFASETSGVAVSMVVNRFLKAQANIFDIKIMLLHKDGRNLHKKFPSDNENSFVLMFNEVFVAITRALFLIWWLRADFYESMFNVELTKYFCKLYNLSDRLTQPYKDSTQLTKISLWK